MLEKGQKIVVIGAGWGGKGAAVRAVERGCEVILIEEEKLGGVCLHQGCIPTKALLCSAKRFLEVKEAGNLGIEVDSPRINWFSIQVRKENIVENLESQLHAFLRNRRIKIIFGKATLHTPKKVIVHQKEGEEILETDKIIIATGSQPLKIGRVDWSSPAVLTPKEALKLKALPQKLIIVGGGVTGVEFATLFSILGSKVTLIEILEDILTAEDLRIRRTIAQILRNQGVEILTGTGFSEILGHGQDLIEVKLNDGRKLLAQKALITVGRGPNTQGLGLENVGVAIDQKGFIVVNEKMETNVEGIYAVGDVTGKVMLAHWAQKSGEIAAENALGENLSINSLCIPHCIYTIPEVGSCGLTEAEARGLAYETRTGVAYFSANGFAMSAGKTFGFLQLAIEAGSGKILGGQMVGEGAAEIIHLLALAVNQKLTVKDFNDRIVIAHPTFSEIVSEAIKNSERRR